MFLRDKPPRSGESLSDITIANTILTRSPHNEHLPYANRKHRLHSVSPPLNSNTSGETRPNAFPILPIPCLILFG